MHGAIAIAITVAITVAVAVRGVQLRKHQVEVVAVLVEVIRVAPVEGVPVGAAALLVAAPSHTQATQGGRSDTGNTTQ